MQGLRKRGMELSLNTIIIGVIVLIVLIVMAILFTSGLGKTNRGIADCSNKGGAVFGSREACIKEGGSPVFEVKDSQGGVGGYCCIPLMGQDSGAWKDLEANIN